METIIFEDKDICIKKTNKNYDFIATIQNKSNRDLYIDFTNEKMEYNDDTIIVQAQDWIGILADEKGYEFLQKLFSKIILPFL